VATALVQRQQYAAARRLLREALDDARLPAARAETFREVFSAAYAGEIGQLTAHAIRAMHEARDSDAVGALARAEELLETVSDEALPPKRREEVGRRLWWGYKKLARRRASTKPLLMPLGTRSASRMSGPTGRQRRGRRWRGRWKGSWRRTPCAFASWPTRAIARPRSCRATACGRDYDGRSATASARTTWSSPSARRVRRSTKSARNREPAAGPGSPAAPPRQAVRGRAGARCRLTI